MLFDSHSHLHFHQFDNDREEVIKKLRDFNVKTINVGTDLEESRKAVELAKKYPDLLCASVGLHPTDTLREDFYINKYEELAKDEKVVAIGECGLDYYNLKSQKSNLKIKDLQKEIFVQQIGLVKELCKPLILHCRPSSGSQDAYQEAIEILKYENPNVLSGNGAAHFFSGSKEIARQFLDLGFYISFAGPITFPSAIGQYKELVEFVPYDRILAETDSPFAAPLPHRGKRNEPAFVKFVIRQIANWKNLSFEKVTEQTTQSAMKLFQL